MKNVDLFAAFASRLFPLLYDNFPVPVKFPKQILVDELESQSELWELKREISTVSGAEEIYEMAGQMTPEIRAKVFHKQSALATKIHEKGEKLQNMGAVFDGTVLFLLNEGFIRTEKNGTYQLTSKGFTHLNKRFVHEGIQDGAKHIDRLVELLRPDNFSGAVVSGTLASLISSIFGG